MARCERLGLRILPPSPTSGLDTASLPEQPKPPQDTPGPLRSPDDIRIRALKRGSNGKKNIPAYSLQGCAVPLAQVNARGDPQKSRLTAMGERCAHGAPWWRAFAGVCTRADGFAKCNLRLRPEADKAISETTGCLVIRLLLLVVGPNWTAKRRLCSGSRPLI